MTGHHFPDAVVARAVAVPLRRKVLHVILEADHPVTIRELTDTLGCSHNAVRQHLAKLCDAALVAESREERDRPGRPRLLYTATTRLDPYARLASLLLVARRTGESPRAAAHRAARAEAVAADFREGDALDALEADATRQGLSPRRVGRGRHVALVLDTCPLADVATDDPSTVCAVHRGLAEGLVEGVGRAMIEAFVARDPNRAGCPIEVRRFP